jgi:polyisoprenoid-binding protein YceI
MLFFRALTALFLTSLWAPAVHAAIYAVDADHSSVSFKIRHLVSKTQGRFNRFEGSIEYEPGRPEAWAASGTIQAASIDTNVEERDKHLRSADFLDVEKFPTLQFQSTGAKDATETGAKLEGVLTMHGVAKPLVLDVTFGGIADDPWGNTRAAFTATAKLNRKDFGIQWNQTLEAGGLLLGEEVEVTLEIEGILKK